MTEKTTGPSCSIASLVGSRPGCNRPKIEKASDASWVCRECGFTFSVLVKEINHG